MIPRFKPYISFREVRQLITVSKGNKKSFEESFSKKFGSLYAHTFSYGRSAIYAFLKAMEVRDKEIIIPAYTCSVVAHAVKLSGNKPRFIDIELDSFNMCLDSLSEAITSNTRAVIATHIFGFPLDIDKLSEIVKEAEAVYNHKIWIIQDCAHSFDAKWEGRSVSKAGDLAIYGLNISKVITSIFGGMLTTDNEHIHQRIKEWKEKNIIKPRLYKPFLRGIYLLSILIAFSRWFYKITYFFQYKTKILDTLTKKYHLDEEVVLPPDFMEDMSDFEARVGLVQLKKYDYILEQKRNMAYHYRDMLKGIEGIIIPKNIEGATYSHFPIRVRNRGRFLEHFRSKGVELGVLLDYYIPNTLGYKENDAYKLYPNSKVCSEEMINLPLYPGLDINRVIGSDGNVDCGWQR